MKLGIIVPYRDRESHLSKFLDAMKLYFKSKKLKYEIIVVEQSDDKPFNRGKLLNIGYLKAKELGCSYIVFHDVDMIPIEVDYSFSELPMHLATNFELEYDKSKNLQFDDYFGGVTMFSSDVFERINGYSNLYWGWGFEDDDLLFRVNQKKIPLDTKIIGKNESKKLYGLTFSGTNSYIKIPKKDLLDFTKDTSILISFKPDDIISNPNKDYDEYTVFSVPGYDTNISYNSFRRYKCDVWDETNNCTSINSEILINHFTQICLTFDSKSQEISFYKDGELVDTKKLTHNIKDYSSEEFFYIGVGSPEREENQNYFYGLISEFAIYDCKLKEKEIVILSENVLENSLLENFRAYKSADNLKLYYDFKFYKNDKIIDLSFNGNDGEIYNSHFVKSQESMGKEMLVPYRRKSLFKLLSHKNNSWNEQNWVHKETRTNQLKFLNQIKTKLYNTDKDGLNSCLYQVLNDISINNYHHLSVLL
jgi:hypothetical protein